MCDCTRIPTNCWGGGIAIKKTEEAKHSPNMVAHNVPRSVNIEHWTDLCEIGANYTKDE